MNTVSHDTAKSYSHTGQQPAGTLARGDSIGTVAASVHDKGSLLPNTAISVPSFNRAFDNRFSAIRMSRCQSFKDVAMAVIAWYGKGELEFIPFPDHLRGRYQSYTEADITALRDLGYDRAFKSVEEGVPLYMDWLKGRA